jgi:hypothetical protein
MLVGRGPEDEVVVVVLSGWILGEFVFGLGERWTGWSLLLLLLPVVFVVVVA